MGPFESYRVQLVKNISSWYSNTSYFLNCFTPWFMRGGTYSDGINSGIFNFELNSGGADCGFRVVLAI